MVVNVSGKVTVAPLSVLYIGPDDWAANAYSPMLSRLLPNVTEPIFVV